MSKEPSTNCLHEWAAIGESQDRARICLKCGVADSLTSKKDTAPSNLPQLLRDAERRVNEHVWGDRRAIVSIPADVSRDVDILLLVAADEIQRLRPMAESWESYEAAQARKAEMGLTDETSALVSAGDYMAHELGKFGRSTDAWWAARGLGGHQLCTVCSPSDYVLKREHLEGWLRVAEKEAQLGPMDWAETFRRALRASPSAQETAAPETSCRYEAAVGSVCNKCGRIHDFGPNRCAECQTPRLCGVERECLRNRYVRPSVQEISEPRYCPACSQEDCVCAEKARASHEPSDCPLERNGRKCDICREREAVEAIDECDHYWHTDGYCVKCETTRPLKASGELTHKAGDVCQVCGGIWQSVSNVGGVAHVCPGSPLNGTAL